VSRQGDARPHLDKAEEFLEAAKVVLEYESFNAACSLAVTSGINSKDVICILSMGYTDKSDNHGKAVADLKKSGPVGAKMAPTLNRLLSKKAKSQYAAPSVTAQDANDAVKQAERFYYEAKRLFTS